MSNATTLTVLYTANLEGRLSILPRLFSVIQRERQQAGGPVFLLDLGDTCARDVELCRQTEGRAPFLVLDGMGYDTAVIGGPEKTPIPPSALRRLHDRMVMPVVIWNRVREFSKRQVSFWVAPGDGVPAEAEYVLRVDRSSDEVSAPGSPPVIRDVAYGWLGRVRITWPEWRVETADRVPVPVDAPAEPIISTLLDFVTHEARVSAQQQGGTL